jgi:hypothetical protein
VEELLVNFPLIDSFSIHTGFALVVGSKSIVFLSICLLAGSNRGGFLRIRLVTGSKLGCVLGKVTDIGSKILL